jgi:hypothetical protein
MNIFQIILNVLRGQGTRLFAEKGFVAIADTNVHTGPFYAILGVSSATLEADGTVSANGDQVADGHVIPDGGIVYGNFASVELQSGTAYAYRI